MQDGAIFAQFETDHMLKTTYTLVNWFLLLLCVKGRVWCLSEGVKLLPF